MTDVSRTGPDRRTDRKRSRSRPDPVQDDPLASPSKYAVDRRDVGNAIGAAFRAARQAQRLSQHQVSALTTSPPLSRTTISAIESGRMPTIEALVSLSDVLHVNPSAILERVHLASPVPVDLTGLDSEELGRRAESLFWAGDFRGALAVYDAMHQRLALDPPADPEIARRLEVKVEIERAVCLRHLSALHAAEVSAKRAVGLARGTPRLQAEAFMVLAALHSHQSHLDLAELEADRAVVLSKDGDPKVEGQAWAQKGNVLARAERFPEARRAFLEARRLAIRARSSHDRVKAEGNLGSCFLALGKRAEAKDRFRTAVDLARKYDDPVAEASWLIELGNVALADDEMTEADRYAEAALRIAKPSDRVLTIFRGEWLRHRIAKRKDPGDDDRHRIAYLRRLYVRVQEHRGIDAIREFREAVLDAEIRREEDDRD